MSRDFSTLTLAHLVATQPWKVPYSVALNNAVEDDRGLGHLMGSHITLHAAKTVGQIAAVFENLDHTGAPAEACPEHLATLRDKAADLVTAAMRIANLYGFDLAQAVVERSEEKNGVTLLPWGAHVGADGPAYVDIVFDRQQGAEAPGFVEVENDNACSIKLGEWVQRGDHWWCLRMTRADAEAYFAGR